MGGLHLDTLINFVKREAYIRNHSNTFRKSAITLSSPFYRKNRTIISLADTESIALLNVNAKHLIFYNKQDIHHKQ